MCPLRGQINNEQINVYLFIYLCIFMHVHTYTHTYIYISHKKMIHFTHDQRNANQNIPRYHFLLIRLVKIKRYNTFFGPGHYRGDKHFHTLLVESKPIQPFQMGAWQLNIYYIFIWRRKWQSTPVLLPGKSHGERNLVGYSPWGCKESDTTE